MPSAILTVWQTGCGAPDLAEPSNDQKLSHPLYKAENGLQDKIKTAKVVMGRAMQLQEQQMMQARDREYDQALDHCMDQDRLQVRRLCVAGCGVRGKAIVTKAAGSSIMMRHPAHCNAH